MRSLEKNIPAAKEEREQENDYKKNREKIISCLEKRITDITDLKPEGDSQILKPVQGGLIGVAEAQINRCHPPLNIPKLLLEGGKSLVLFGPNGSGKSTLFDGLTQKNNADISQGAYVYNKGFHGKDSLRIARLNQEELLADVQGLPVEQVLKIVEDYYKNQFPVDWEDADAYEQNLANQDAQQRIEELVGQFKKLFEMELFLDRKVNELSGGEKTKLSLLMLLSSEPDQLLLDEPTNHLDLESISKLAGLFNAYKRAGANIVSVSHVEWFLEMVGENGTLELQMDEEGNRILISSSSPYKKYIKQKPKEAIIKGSIDWNREVVKKPGQLFLTSDEFSIPDSPLKDIKLPTMQGEDIVIFSGKNGTGKTKLMEEMADSESDIIKKAKGIKVAYMPQFWPEEIADGTVENFFLWVKDKVSPRGDLARSRSKFVLGQSNFLRGKEPGHFKKELSRLGFETDRDVLKEKIANFSGGQQRLLWFVAASLLEGIDALILDEPSNHMDGPTMERVVEAIRNFNGTVILSTHDLRLMQELERNAGKSRAGQGVRNIVFERKGDNTMINEIKESPAAYAKNIILQAQKSAKRVKIR